MTKKRLGIVIGSLQTGGSELQLIHFLENIDRSRFAPIVFTTRNEGPLSHRIASKNIEVIPLEIRRKRLLSSSANFYRILREREIEVLYCLLCHSIILGSIIGTLAGVDYIVGGLRGLGMTWSAKEVWGLRLCQLFVHRFIVNTKAVKRIHASREWIRTEKFEIVPNGLDLNLFPYTPEKQNIIGIVGALKGIKGQSQFIKAANILVKNGHNYNFMVVGDGPDKQDLEQLVDGLGLRNRFTFTGNVDNVWDYVKNFKILVSASAFEGLSNAIIEAMSTGTPVVASNVPSNDESVSHMMNGLLYEYGNYKQLASRIAFLLNNPELYKDMQKNCRNKAEVRHRMDLMVRRTENILQGK
jgi:glycosyltransferase involved in cell wall biosynthesis